MQIKNSALTKIVVSVTFDLSDTQFAEYKKYTVFVTLVPKGDNLVYKTRTTVSFPDTQFEKEITEAAKQEALKVTSNLL
jgi:hypothetical protein